MRQRSSSPVFYARHSPASKAQDINRLLDPAYSSAPLSSTAYVDRHGELHDPDYRHFPVIRPRSESDDDDKPQDDHFSPRHPSPKRPVYSYSSIVHSYDSQDTVLDDDRDDDARPTGVSRIISRTRELTRKRRSLDAASQSSFTDTPTTTTTAVSEDHFDDTASHHHPLSHTLSHHSYHSDSPYTLHRRHRSHSHLAVPTEEYTPTDHEREEVWTPTCAQALRRQWQAVSLRIRFSVFRAQRRIKTRLAML